MFIDASVYSDSIDIYENKCLNEIIAYNAHTHEIIK